MRTNAAKALGNIKYDDLVIHQDKDFTFLNKPPFLSSLEDRNSKTNILGIARNHDPDAIVCHRLDKETSGVIVIANHNDAYRHFAGQLENKEVKKVYHAVLDGLHKFENFEADEPLSTTSTKSRVDGRGKPSLTLISTLEVFKEHTLVKCLPITGRMHQIRAHLAYHKAPIICDPTYGGPFAYLSDLKRNFNQKKWEEEKPMIGRVALHASQVAYRTMDGKTVQIEAPYPKDFVVLLKQMRKYS